MKAQKILRQSLCLLRAVLSEKLRQKRRVNKRNNLYENNKNDDTQPESAPDKIYGGPTSHSGLKGLIGGTEIYGDVIYVMDKLVKIKNE